MVCLQPFVSQKASCSSAAKPNTLSSFQQDHMPMLGRYASTHQTWQGATTRDDLYHAERLHGCGASVNAVKMGIVVRVVGAHAEC